MSHDETLGDPVSEESSSDESVVYDGTNDEILPEIAQMYLEDLPSDEACHLRDKLSGQTVESIEAWLTNVEAEPIVSPPGFPPEPPEVHQEIPDPWKITKGEISHIAEMFEKLMNAGMPPEMAIGVIESRAPAAFPKMIPVATRTGTIPIRTAGPVAEILLGGRDPYGSNPYEDPGQSGLISGLASHFGATILGNNGQ